MYLDFFMQMVIKSYFFRKKEDYFVVLHLIQNEFFLSLILPNV